MEDKELSLLVRSCLKKTRYESKRQAQEVRNRIHKKRGTDLRIYYCDNCLGYHLTHKGAKEKKHNASIKSKKINECRIAEQSTSY